MFCTEWGTVEIHQGLFFGVMSGRFPFTFYARDTAGSERRSLPSEIQWMVTPNNTRVKTNIRAGCGGVTWPDFWRKPKWPTRYEIK